jgi:hypothetical protein
MNFTKDYTQADKYVVINGGDSQLRPIVLKLPTPPKKELIDGYGLAKEDQFFVRKEIPSKLKLIEKRASKKCEEMAEQNKNARPNGYHIQKEFWKIIEEEKESLEPEIKWIKTIHWYSRWGYWFYNYGKPTWITPWYFDFLNFYYIDEAGSFPEYRDRDRRAELAAWYSYTSTETFEEIDDSGNALSLKMKDVGGRVFYGTIEPKRRRGGCTARALSHGLSIMCNEHAAYCDIIADIGEHAEGIFNEKLSPAWYHYPLWKKPVYDGDDRPSRSISLVHPKTVMKERCIGSEFGYTKSSDDKANDSRKLGYLLCDEEGKGAKRGDVKRRWGINKLTMSQMLTIRGYTDHPSTVEEMKDGGIEYKSMFEMSDFYVRKPSGQTTSGLFSLFIPADDGADDFIDRWGYSVRYAPTEEQIKYAPIGNKYAVLGIGARQMLERELNIYLADGSPDKLKEYRETLRKNPLDSTDCWKGTAGDMGFNNLIIDKALIDCKDAKVYRGNFKWENDILDSKVIWVDDKLKGRFDISDFLIGRDNKKRMTLSNHFDEEKKQFVFAWGPENPNICTAGVDGFDYRTASQMRTKEFGSNTNLSDGGFAIVLNPDPLLNKDLPDKDWPTPRTIVTYRNRPDMRVFAEDVLMASVYCGAMVNGERNKPDVIEHFIKRGYASYLLYMMTADGRVDPSPWTWSGGTTKNEMLNQEKSFIDIHGHKEVHAPLLMEMKSITSPERLHHYDLLAAHGWAVYGMNKGYQKKYERLNTGNVVELTGILSPHEYD